MGEFMASFSRGILVGNLTRDPELRFTPSGQAIEGTDFHAVVNRRIAVTPIHLDLTGRRLLRRLKTWAWPPPTEPRPPEPGAPDPPSPTAAHPPGPGEPAAVATEERLAEEPRAERR